MAEDIGRAGSSVKEPSKFDLSDITGDKPTSNLASSAEAGLLDVSRLERRSGVVAGLWSRDDMFREEKSLNNDELKVGSPNKLIRLT